MKVTEHHFADPLDQAQALAKAVAQQIQLLLNKQDYVSLAVSGGRSPIKMFEALREHDLNWSCVYITLVDERCVPENHPDSNACLVRNHLLRGPAAQAKFISWLPSWTPELFTDPNQLAALAQKQLAQLPHPLDVVILGMGEDGHTASWFSDSPGIDKVFHHHTSITWLKPSRAQHLRLTLTIEPILAAKHIHLSLGGQNKKNIYQQAKSEEKTDLPVSWVLHRAQHIDAWIFNQPLP